MDDLIRGQDSDLTVMGAKPYETVAFMYSTEGIGVGPAVGFFGGMTLGHLGSGHDRRDRFGGHQRHGDPHRPDSGQRPARHGLRPGGRGPRSERRHVGQDQRDHQHRPVTGSGGLNGTRGRSRHRGAGLFPFFVNFGIYTSNMERAVALTTPVVVLLSLSPLLGQQTGFSEHAVASGMYFAHHPTDDHSADIMHGGGAPSETSTAMVGPTCS